jgi:hypothetical protein
MQSQQQRTQLGAERTGKQSPPVNTQAVTFGAIEAWVQHFAKLVGSNCSTKRRSISFLSARLIEARDVLVLNNAHREVKEG